MTVEGDRNDLAVWFPPLEQAGLRVPRTIIVPGPEEDLVHILDGRSPKGWAEFHETLEAAVARIGTPCFLRTGHGSGKHSWSECCHVTDIDLLPHHVVALVEWSHMAMPSLPTDTWVVRELIPTVPMFHCGAFRGLPVTREFRLFVRDDQVVHIQPYWPAEALEEARPSLPHWRQSLRHAAKLTPEERMQLTGDGVRAVAALGGGYWSVDFLNDEDGGWWLIDMAEGERSFRYES